MHYLVIVVHLELIIGSLFVSCFSLLFHARFSFVVHSPLLLFVIQCSLFDVRYSLFDVRYSMFASRYSVFVI